MEQLALSTDRDVRELAQDLLAARAAIVQAQDTVAEMARARKAVEHDANAAIARLQRELNERPVL